MTRDPIRLRFSSHDSKRGGEEDSKRDKLEFKTEGRRDELTDAAPLLASGPIEPCLDIVLPVLLEVPIGDNVVVLNLFALFLSYLPANQRNNLSKNK